jgi:co-chaperonin GroES (HSP10)
MLEEVETEESKSSFILPDDYERPKSEYVKVSVYDCTATELDIGRYIIVPRHMIQEINVDGETYHLVLDNYVLASIE